ncbi:MAG: histidinol-phosphate transaminase [Luteimonas sp.]
MNPLDLAQPAFQRLRAYDPGHDLVALRHAVAPDRLVELGSNENPYGPAPGVRLAIDAVLSEVNRYPDPFGGDLKRALGQRHAISPNQIILGNGSHELLMQVGQVFSGPGAEVVLSQFGFAVFAIAAHAAGADPVVVPALSVDAPMPRGHDLDALAAAVTARTRVLFLANPNNPTGTWFAPEALKRLLAVVPEHVVVVVDEAYAELADAPDYASALSLLPSHRNLLVTRTFSKAYALAGLRIGYAVGAAALISVLERVRESFNVNNVALAAAEAALADREHLGATRRENVRQRAALAQALAQRGWRVSPSQGNFLLVEFGAHAATIEAGLLQHGVVPRPMAGYGLPQCLRISVGDAVENRRLLAALDALASRA